MFASGGTSVSSRLSMNSSNREVSLVVLIFYFDFRFWEDRLGLPTLDSKYRHFVVLLDSERYSVSPAGTMFLANLRWCLTMILGQQRRRNFLSCAESFSQSWSDVGI